MKISFDFYAFPFVLFEGFVSEENEDLDEDLDEDLVVPLQRLDGQRQRLFHVHLKGTCIGPLGKTWDKGGEGLSLDSDKAERLSRSEPSKVPTPPCQVFHLVSPGFTLVT